MIDNHHVITAIGGCMVALCRFLCLFTATASMLGTLLIGADVQGAEFTFLDDLVRQRLRISHGILKVSVSHDIARVTLQSYQGVTREIYTEFYADQDLWRQEVQLVHPNWSRRTASLVNSDGAFHDAGGSTLYGTFTSADKSKSISESRPDTYDFRWLGLRFPLNQLVAPADWQPALSWSEQLQVEQIDELTGESGHLLRRYLCSSELGVRVKIVIDETAGNVPLMVEQSLNEHSTVTTMSYREVDVMLDSGVLDVIWFPQEITHEMRLNGDAGYREVLKVVKCDFVREPELSRFSIESFDLPEGRRVLGDGHVQMVIDGDLRRASGRDVMNPDNVSYTLLESWGEPLQEHPERSTVFAVLLAVNACAAITALACFVYARRKKERRK